MKLYSTTDEKCISFDLWGTLLIKIKPNYDSHRAVLKRLNYEFSLDADEELVFSYWNDLCDGQMKFNHQSNFDPEFSMADTYLFLANLLFSNQVTVDRFVARAITLELEENFKNSRPNVKMMKMLESRNWGSRDLIISDFEGSAVFIKDLLWMHGLSWRGKIFTSSDRGLSKRTGRIYVDLLQEFEITRHIGDHIFSDFLNPRKKGIRCSLLLSNSLQLFLHILRSKFLRHFIRMSYFLTRLFTVLQGLFVGKSALQKTLNDYIQKLRDLDDINVMFLFMGSEGAYFSQLYFKDDMGPIGSYLCLSIGRLDLLELLGLYSPQAQVARLLLDKSDSIHFDKIVHKTGSGNFLLLSKLIHRNTSSQISSDLLSFFSKIDLGNYRKVIVVDIGYNHTAAFCIDRIINSEVTATQMIGFKKISQSSKFLVWNAVTLSRLRDSKYLRTKYLEYLLSAGPRSSHGQYPEFRNFQKEFCENSNARTQFKTKQAILGFSTYPNRRMRKYFLAQKN